ncbi:hypothetical protein HC891_15760 [Candidatus Gracilibacteria bacterium]|nr:hypothetical protein [Candidatus Gracilibacteria bacterium]
MLAESGNVAVGGMRHVRRNAGYLEESAGLRHPYRRFTVLGQARLDLIEGLGKMDMHAELVLHGGPSDSAKEFGLAGVGGVRAEHNTDPPSSAAVILSGKLQARSQTLFGTHAAKQRFGEHSTHARLLDGTGDLIGHKIVIGHGCDTVFDHFGQAQ